jgi:hypothetical protein
MSKAKSTISHSYGCLSGGTQDKAMDSHILRRFYEKMFEETDTQKWLTNP